MADNNYEGFSDESLKNALAIQNSMAEIQSSATRLNNTLRRTSNETGTFSNLFSQVKQSASKVAEIQERAAKTAKGAAGALEQQAKQLSTVRQLNLEIDRLYVKASTETGSVKVNLERQARNLSEARDNAKELANTYEAIAKDSAKLNAQTSFFSQLSAVAGKIPILNKFSTPFDKAAEASRKITLENAKVKFNQENINKLQNVNLRTGQGLTQQAIRRAGLEQLTQGKTGPAAAKLLRDYQQTAKVQSQFGAGIKAATSSFSGMGGMLGKAGWIGLLVKAIEFIVDLLVGAQERTVEIAKDLSITRNSAEGIRQQYIAIAAQSSNLLVNTKSLVEAQQAFSEYSQAVSWTTQAALTNQVFLTKNLGIAADKAADLNYLMEATGQDIEGSTDMVGGMSKNFAKINGFTVPTAKILKTIANTSKEIQGYFGFSVKNLAQGVLQMSKFGLELTSALSLSKSLLDFESSISNELELELLTGKELNLEKARAMAITGDIAGATNQVLTQMQDLTEEQRKSPLIMESMAKTAGISADELNRAYIISKKLGVSEKVYYDQLVAQGRVKEANNLIDQLGEQATKAEMEKTLTAQDAFNAALEKAKDQFSGLVSSGALDMLVDVIVDFAKTMKDWGFGKEAGEKRTDEQAKAAQTTLGKSTTEGQKETLEKLRIQAGGSVGFFKTSTSRKVEAETLALAEKLGIDYDDARDQIAQEAAKKIQEIEQGKRIINPKTNKTEEVKVKDFIIKPMNEDTITMAGGTKLGGNVENLLTELITAVKQGSNIYLGTNKVSEALGTNLHTIG
jgi:hypothetical protein